MTARKDTLFERFLAPVFRLLINQEELRQLHDCINWQDANQRLRNPTLQYPDYYRKQNFHGIEGGYLNTSAAVTYDPITQYVLPPNEDLVRQGVINTIQGNPRRILDLGCGTGSSTLLLKQHFPQAEVIGLDLSPYMLLAAERKASAAGLALQWCHGNAEQTEFSPSSFDLVTASLLFHETPPPVSQSIVKESYRLLTEGGEMVVLDGNQKTLRHTDWLTQIFEEPYIKDYAANSLDAWMGAAGFVAVYTDDWWWIHQISRGVKPSATQEENSEATSNSTVV
jgi:ubiquinone/menaquinone biosynthesis C-methylase UbiE